MEIIIVVLLVVLIGVVVGLFRQLTTKKDKTESIETILNSKFIDFSDRIRRTMDQTRMEVEKSKDSLSRNAIKTLENIDGMKEVVSTLARQQERVQELGQSLEYLLQMPKLRGNYGETILEEMLDRVLPKGIWEKQYTIAEGDRVDAVVKYKDVIIPIDSKFPKEDYQKYLDGKNPAEKKAHWANYQRALKIQINLVKDKYVRPEKGTSEFALLFIPSESIYYETIAETNYLGNPSQMYEYASDRKVIPVSPNTFYAFLQIVMLGVRNVEIARGAKKLQNLLSKLEKDFDLFYKKFTLIGKNLETASESYRTGDGHIKRFKRNLGSAIKIDDVSQLDAKAEPLENEKQEIVGATLASARE
ncbi:MAG: DNA recombination protein RmuC [Candidatus Omnitrophica bacterium]|nr:DNA recombination protein RmuC [Candidatus Omnitrophota bacterium]